MIREAIKAGKPELAISVDTTFAERFSDYMKDFGTAAPRQDVMASTLAEMPVDLLRLIDCQMVAAYDASAIASELEKKRAEAEGETERANLPAEVKSRIKNGLVRARRAYALHDEETIYTLHVCDGIVRYTLLELGSRIAAKGVVNKRDDVFMLTLDEARNALSNGGDLRDLVRKRAGERMWALANPGPPSYGTPPSPPPSLSVFPAEAQTLMRAVMWCFSAANLGMVRAPPSNLPGVGGLKGVPASAGKYEGIVRVVRNESEFSKLCPGDVLVCVSTSPAWSVIYSTIGALITEAGGVLSHPAIIAREYGIPAILSVEGATQKLRDGQRVRVDGNNGTVTVMAQGES
jgi:pyruvate,water dikinase